MWLGDFVSSDPSELAHNYHHGCRHVRPSRRARATTRVRLRVALGPRDEPPPQTAMGGRAERALNNLSEAMPVFLTLALLHLIEGTSDRLAVLGGQIFLAARVRAWER